MRIITGDLTTIWKQIDCAIGHQCNCEHVMGSGVAQQIRATFPEAFEADLLTDLAKDKLGTFSRGISYKSILETEHGKVERRVVVYNIYSQFSLSEKGEDVTCYDCLARGVRAVLEDIKKDGDYPLCLPYLIGCGLAGGDWKTVEGILLDAEKDENSEIVLIRK